MSSWNNYKEQCKSDTTLPRSISNEEDLKQVLNILLGQMPPGEFFDLTIIADSFGKVLITEPGIPVEQMPVNDGTTADEIKLGILQSNMNISTEDYLVFQAPLSLEWETDHCISDENGDENVHETEIDGVPPGGRQIILYAALSQDTLNQVRWRIPFIAIYFLLSLVILIVVSYPVIRILGMGRGDSMTGSQVYQTGLSLILVSLFIGFSISYFASRSEIKKNQKKSVNTLIENVEWFHKIQIDTYAKLLETFINYGADSVYSEEAKYKELVNISYKGEILDFWHYGKFEPKLDTVQQTLPNLAKRHYFKQADTETFYHGSHFSYLDGDFEGVISKKVFQNNSPDSLDVYVQAITFSFDEYNQADSSRITRTLFESRNCLNIHIRKESFQLNKLGLKYLIINERGEVYYQPPSVNISISNLKNAIHPRQWNEIRALMQNNNSTETPLQINIFFEGQRFHAYLHKLSTKPLNLKESSWILVFDDPNLLAFRSYSVFMYSAVGYLFLLIIFLTVGLISYAFRPKVYYLTFRRFSQYLFRPSFMKRKEYVVLSLIVFTLIVYFIIIFLMDIHHFWLLLLLFGLTAPFIILSRHLLLSDFLQKQRTLASWKFPLSVLAIILLILYFLFRLPDINSRYIWLTIILIGIQAGLIYFIVRAFNNYPFQIQKKLTKYPRLHSTTGFLKAFIRNPNQMFSFTFAFWMLLIGMIAGYAIHHSAFHYEDKLWELAVEHRTVEPQHHNDNYNHEEHISKSTSHDHNMRFHPEKSHPFLDYLEYWRRQWLFNYTGIEYPVINRYIYAGRSQILDAFVHDHAAKNDHSKHAHHSKNVATVSLIVLAFLAGFVLLYFLVKNLSKRIFLTEYREFIPDPEPAPKIKDYTYILTPDPENALTVLQSGFLKNKKYNELNLSGRSEREKLRWSEGSGNVPFGPLLKDADGIVLLNADRALRSPDDIENLTDLITTFKRKEKFVLMTGSISIKDLRESVSSGRNPEWEHALLNWMDVTGSFFTSLIPVGYGLKSPETGKEPSGNKYVNKLKREILFGPHTEANSLLIKRAENEAEVDRFHKKEYEKYILNIQRHNKSYYQNLWDQLTFREKQLVYNYSNEGFINYSNVDVFTELLQKGIFRYDRQHEEIRLFNMSFSNFATQAVTVQLSNEFKKDKKANGNVSHLRNALLTIIFLTILAISLFAPDLPERYIGAISGGLALISSLASVANKLSLNIPFLEK